MNAADIMDDALWLVAYPHAALFRARARRYEARMAGDAALLHEAELDEILALEAVLYRRLRDQHERPGATPEA